MSRRLHPLIHAAQHYRFNIITAVRKKEEEGTNLALTLDLLPKEAEEKEEERRVSGANEAKSTEGNYCSQSDGKEEACLREGRRSATARFLSLSPRRAPPLSDH